MKKIYSLNEGVSREEYQRKLDSLRSGCEECGLYDSDVLDEVSKIISTMDDVPTLNDFYDAVAE